MLASPLPELPQENEGWSEMCMSGQKEMLESAKTNKKTKSVLDLKTYKSESKNDPENIQPASFD